MAEPSNRDDDWRRKHSLLASWHDAAKRLRHTSLLSIAVDDHDEAVADRVTLHRMARFCSEGERTPGDGTGNVSGSVRPELRTEPFEAAPALEPSGEAPGPDRSVESQTPGGLAHSSWQPAPSSATHLEPSAPASQLDELSESLREVRNELNLLRERRARRYF